jgi:hypothetical protein
MSLEGFRITPDIVAIAAKWNADQKKIGEDRRYGHL